MKKLAILLNRFAPDIGVTFSRFPATVILLALSTAVFIALANEWINDSDESWFLFAFGAAFGAIYATAGALNRENANNFGFLGIVLVYLVPIIVIGLMQIVDTGWIISPMLGPIGLLWLSLAAFIGNTGIAATDEERKTLNIAVQNRFWWLNQRAIASGIIAAFGFLLIVAGIFAIENSLSVLFGFRSEKFFYQILLPLTGLFFIPFYWLSTIPKLYAYSEDEILEPEFLSLAIGFMGQFVMVPFLFVYSLILLAYGVQIVFAGELPHGTLSWMVLAYTIAGAATWLILHPSFMHSRPLVKYFRRFWFLMTIVPILLYWAAVVVRINAYGFTGERIWLIAGGLWATLLAIAFISKKFADIRLVPGIALLLMILIGFGPLNFLNAPKILYSIRLENSLYAAVPLDGTKQGTYIWSEENAKIARDSIEYLFGADPDSPRLLAILDRQGIEYEGPFSSSNQILKLFALSQELAGVRELNWRNITLGNNVGADISKAPFFLGTIKIVIEGEANIGGLDFAINNDKIVITSSEGSQIFLAFNDWVAQQEFEVISQPAMDFVLGDKSYRLLIQFFNFGQDKENNEIKLMSRFQALLFSSEEITASITD